MNYVFCIVSLVSLGNALFLQVGVLDFFRARCKAESECCNNRENSKMHGLSSDRVIISALCCASSFFRKRCQWFNPNFVQPSSNRASQRASDGQVPLFRAIAIAIAIGHLRCRRSGARVRRACSALDARARNPPLISLGARWIPGLSLRLAAADRRLIPE